MPRMLIIKGPNLGVTYELGDRARIGRLGENEIQVPDPNVSRIHAEIVYEHDAFVIYDRGSKNGVIINGHAVAEKALEPGDEIIIGGSTFLYDGNLEIHNARFSNNSVYYVIDTSRSDATKKVASGIDSKAAGEAGPASELLRIVEAIAAPHGPLPAVTERICGNVRNLFDADHAVLFLKDHENAELRPFEAAPRGEPACVHPGLLARVAEEKRPLKLSDTLAVPEACDLDGTGATDTEDDLAGSENKTISSDIEAEIREKKSSIDGRKETTMLCAPILTENDTLLGLLLVTKVGAGSLPTEGLTTLQALAGLASVVVQAAITTDRARNSPPVVELESDQRTASTRSLRMQEIYNSARRSADGGGAILITGETGTGKESLARFIHENGNRADGPFIVVNCAAIPPDQFESELFGHAKDGDEGVAQTVPGKVELAMGGTLLLDEVGELDLMLQPKLLRFLQDRAFYRVGGTNAVEADIRVMASSSADLAAAVRAGKFREDLWYRLNVVPFHVPPLRERREDIGPLVDLFINRHATRLNRKVLGTNDSAISLLQKYDWPGNILELENAVERAVLLAESKVLSTSDFSHIEEARRRLNSQADLERKRDTKPLAEVERQHIIIALKKHNFNQARAAEALGLHRNTLRNKIIEYGIEIPK